MTPLAPLTPGPCRRCSPRATRATATPSRLVLAAALALVACGGAPKRAAAPPDPLVEVSADELYRRGVEQHRAGDYVRAEQYLQAARDRGYDPDQVVSELIGVCVDASRYQAALRYALPHLDKHPDDWSLRYLVASLYLATDEPAQARAELERTIAKQPDQPGPHYLLGFTLAEKLNQPEAASRAYQRYLELAPEGEHAAEARDWLEAAGRAAAAAGAADWHPVTPPGEATP